MYPRHTKIETLAEEKQGTEKVEKNGIILDQELGASLIEYLQITGGTGGLFGSAFSF